MTIVLLCSVYLYSAAFAEKILDVADHDFHTTLVAVALLLK